ncbi:MAG: Ribosomal RNA small subunit methyltransferase C [Hyphomicrobiaceae bacterium hypho_1]
MLNAIYGQPHPTLINENIKRFQTSPRVPGAKLLSNFTEATLDSIAICAPENTLERQYVLAQGILAVKPQGSIIVLAANTKGGTRLVKELKTLGCNVECSHRRHHKIAVCHRPHRVQNFNKALISGSPRYDFKLGFWTQPGLFSWNRIDPGSSLLLSKLPPLSGVGADLGCGYGILAKAVATTGRCRKLTLIDLDFRALDMSKRNVKSEAIETCWSDIRYPLKINNLDFVITNPPFHDRGIEDRTLGHAFIRQAATILRPGGVLWMTANKHLPYEELLNIVFNKVILIAQNRSYKIFKALK